MTGHRWAAKQLGILLEKSKVFFDSGQNNVGVSSLCERHGQERFRELAQLFSVLEFGYDEGISETCDIVDGKYLWNLCNFPLQFQQFPLCHAYLCDNSKLVSYLLMIQHRGVSSNESRLLQLYSVGLDCGR